MRLLQANTCLVSLCAAFSLCACSGGNVQVAPTARDTATPSGTPTNTPGPNATSTPAPNATPTLAPNATATPTQKPTSTPAAPATPTAAPTSGTFTADDWPLFDHDSARSGVSNEVTGTHGAVTLTKLWQTKLGDVADSAPVEKAGMLFVTVHNGTTYGISASTGAIVWTFVTTGPNITTSEPAYDVTGNKVYAGGVDGKIHRLNPTTGVEDTTGGFPVLITLATQTEKDASPLNIANGYVYAQTSGYDGDGDPYVGHVAAINMSTGQLQVFNTLCSGTHALMNPSNCSEQRSGMWSRSGVVVDPDSTMSGHIYVATGNGHYDPANGNYGDSMLSLTSNAATLSAAYAPSNAATLESDDLDLGSSSPALIPRQPGSSTPLMATEAGKDGTLRLLDRTNLGGANAALQDISLADGLFSAPAVYADPNGNTYVYVGLSSGVTAYQVTTQNGVTQLTTAWTTSLSMGNEGTSPAVRDGVVYVAATNELLALDAATGAMLGSNSALGSVHWESPIIAHGIVYCTDQSDNLTAFTIGTASSTTARRR